MSDPPIHTEECMRHPSRLVMGGKGPTCTCGLIATRLRAEITRLRALLDRDRLVVRRHRQSRPRRTERMGTTMSNPGRRWRVLAWEGEEKIETRDRGIFDELVVDGGVVMVRSPLLAVNRRYRSSRSIESNNGWVMVLTIVLAAEFVKDWLHVEQMDDDEWWLQIGRHGQHLTVWVTTLSDGTPQVEVTEDETDPNPLRVAVEVGAAAEQEVYRLTDENLRLQDEVKHLTKDRDRWKSRAEAAWKRGVLPLPPVKRDRHGVRWLPRWVDGSPTWPGRKLVWGSDGAEVQMTLTHRELAERGPFTEEDDHEYRRRSD